MRHPLDARDAGIALILGGAALTLYLLTPQARIYGDGIWLVNFLPPHPGMPHHAAFTPHYQAVKALFPGLELLEAARLVCQIAGGLAVGLAFAIVRAFGVSRVAAVSAVLLFAVSPVTWFFSTQIEFHAPYLAWVTIAATVCLFGPWRRSPALALALSALVLVPTFLSHEIFALLGPGWVLLVQFARVRKGAGRYSARGLLLLVGPVLLAGLVAAILLEPWIHRGGAGSDVSDEVQVLSRFLRTGFLFETLLDGWLRPLVLLVPLAVVGLVSFARERRTEPRTGPRIGHWKLAALSVLIGVPLAFFLLAYNVPERGGFSLGPAPFLLVCVAGGLGATGAALSRPGLPPFLPGAALAILVGVQAFAAWSYRRGFDYGYDPLERVARVREVLGEEGELLVGHAFAPSIERFLEGVRERSIEKQALHAFETGQTPEQFVRRLERFSPDPAARPAAVDLNYRKVPDFEEFDTFPEFFQRYEKDLRPYFDAFAAYIDREYETTLFDHASWPLLRLDRRRSGPGAREGGG